MTSRARRYGTLLSVVLALFLTMALTACSDEGDPGGEGTPGSLLERAAEREATQEAGDAEPTREGIFGIGSQSTAESEEAAELDRSALVALYRATDGDSWTTNDGWLSDDPVDQWHGVTTDADGRVIALDLNDNNLTGTVPPELHALTALTLLDLGDNRLNGCLPINLQDQLGVADSDLGDLLFCCGAPPGPANPPPAQTSAESDKEALLAIFDATDGDSWDESGTWAGRKPIGEWAGVTTDEDGRVVGLDLDLGGAEIPPEVGHLTGLTTLALSGVSGALPPELGYLVNLPDLDLSDNRLCGEIPRELGRLASLQSLHLGSNQLTGEIPSELGGLASLQSLHLGSNQLTGEIPPELGGLGSLQSLNLQGNQLTGEIPSELGGLGSLQSLNLESNQLSGEIPLELDDLVLTLEEIRLDGNQLGCISSVLDGAGYAGEIPVCTTEDHPGDTEALIAQYNAWGQPGLENWLSREPLGEWEGVSVDATGRVVVLNVRPWPFRPEDIAEIAAELGSLASLRVLDLSGIRLTGEIPAELGSLANLRVLDLSGSNLTGEIPAELGSLASLQVLDLSDNDLTGEIPAELGGLASLRVLSLPDIRLTGEILRNWANLRVRVGGANIWVGAKFASVSAGSDHTCGVRTDGSVACWGDDEYGQSTPPEGQFASVSAGSDHTCGVRTDGSVACWGDDEYGQSTPPEGQFASVSAGQGHACGVRTDGSVACWGDDEYGRSTPPEGEFASVSAARIHTCGVRTDGSVACWGESSEPPAGQFASVSAGLGHACGVRTDGLVACWGSDYASKATPWSREES